MKAQVEILLSTYNGVKYLNIQLDSILQQDYPDWKLLIRDDGSSDSTIAILKSYVQKYPDKITLLNDDAGNLGFSVSFITLLKNSSADFVMFCDQDDYWHPAKISTMLAVMLEEETLLPDSAHIVFSDLEVGDADLKITSSSFLNMAGYSPYKGNQIFFLKNYVPGCNMLFNRRLIEEVLKTENIIALHDHWILMVGSAIGKLTYIQKPLMIYRMHDNNAIGFFEYSRSTLQRVSVFIKDILKYLLNNKAYREKLYTVNIKQMRDICLKMGVLVSKDSLLFANAEHETYFVRKIGNITKPYLLEKSILKQLTYIICF